MSHGHELRWGEECKWEGVCRAEGNEGEGGEWDNCNSIINKVYYKKKIYRSKNKGKFPGMSNLRPTGHMQPRMAMNVAKLKIVNLLKTL